MKNKRKVTLGITGVAVAVMLMVGLTMAYLTDSRSVENLLGIGAGTDSSGNVKQSVMIDLAEPSFVAHADKVTYDPANSKVITAVEKSNLLPGDSIYKDPTVVNAGLEQVFVRVKLEITDEQMETLKEEFGLLLNTDMFKKGTDGYWYYTAGSADTCAKLDPDASVGFFKTSGDAPDKISMTIPATWKNSDLDDFLGPNAELIFNMKITAQAIQGRNFTPTGLSWAGVAESDIQAVAIGNR